ncbi:MAG: NUDIX hydrolase [Rhizobiaceae bacterium]
MSWPKTGVSVALFRGASVLLIQRGKEPFRGVWSLPGGAQNAGETVGEAAQRELREETGLTASQLMFVEIVEPIRRDDSGKVAAHFVLAVHAGFSAAGEAMAGDDADGVQWVRLDQLSQLQLTPSTEEVIQRCHVALTRK